LNRVSEIVAHLSVERLRTTDKPIVANEETQRPVGCVSNANPFTLADWDRRITVAPEPQWAGFAEIDAVQTAIDL
jgi:hypothetical protein